MMEDYSMNLKDSNLEDLRLYILIQDGDTYRREWKKTKVKKKNIW